MSTPPGSSSPGGHAQHDSTSSTGDTGDSHPRLAAALWYASLGWAVMPIYEPVLDEGGGPPRCSCGHADCDSIGKHPRTAHGYKDASTDEAVIRAWWAKWPAANVGIATGALTGTAVLDVDPRHGGDVTLAELEAKHGKLPATVEALTGGGGRHLVFAHPGKRIKNKVALAPGLDVRGDGGLIVVEPSLHTSGRGYAWELSSRPSEVPLAPMPSWLLAMILGLLPTPDDSATCRGGPQVQGGVIPDGSRNATLASLAGSMRRRAMSQAAILAALREENKRCAPPLDDAEVQRIVTSIAQYPPGEGAGEIAAPWEPPVPLYREPAPPPFPLDDAFPEALAEFKDFIRGLAYQLQVPVDLLAMLLLAVLAAALSKKFEIEAREGWREMMALWVLVLLESGERKSAAFKKITEPVHEWEKDQAERLGPGLAAAREAREILEQERKEARKKASKGDAQAKDVALRLAQELAALVETLPPTLITTDATSEALIGLMMSSGERALVASPEADALDVMMGRYDDKARPNMGAWLKSYSGDRVRVHRRGRAPEFLDKPALSVAMTVQPEAVRGMFGSPVAKGRGFLARFFTSVPRPMVGRRKVGTPPVEERLEMIYVTSIRRLLDLELDLAQGPRVVRLEPAAAALFVRFESRIEAELARGGGLGDRKEWGAKLCGGILRIALALHGLECFGRPTGRSPASCLEVNEATMRAALAWAPYLIDHERLAASAAGCDPDVAVADRILSWIGRVGFEEFSRRDCFDQCRGTLVRGVADIDGPLRLLCELGYTRPIPAAGTGRSAGRPASPRFAVNPMWPGRGGAP